VCEVLTLDVDNLHPDLLGLVVMIPPPGLHVILAGQARPGALPGNLLCNLAGGLDNNQPVAAPAPGVAPAPAPAAPEPATAPPPGLVPSGVIAPVASAVAPVVAPVASAVAPLASAVVPVAPALAPVVAPVPGALPGRRRHHAALASSNPGLDVCTFSTFYLVFAHRVGHERVQFDTCIKPTYGIISKYRTPPLP
jgi:hypothetical protein